ncbi:hypothetical protein F4818DRAFT_439928 [Hypoxylon cercidicola]|nr:hypothetical protein F4818DRAFT_439928 [Hypoxylon cercidicola]
MAFTNRIMALAAIFLFVSNIELAQSLDMTYCASINTGSTPGNSSIYQSDGLCHDFCLSEYAFSVIQDDSCWCSNYVPDESTQVDPDECNKSCSGFPSDTCGGDGLWGYIGLVKEPAGTTGGSTSSPTSTPDPITRTVQNTVTVTPTVHATTSTSTSTSVPDKDTTDRTTTTAHTTSTTPTPTPSPSESVHTVTAGGTVSLQTITVIPTVTAGPETGASSDANSTGMTASHQGLSPGQAAGVAIGVLGAVAIAVAIVVFFLMRRRRRGQSNAIDDPSGSHRGSSAGMMSTPTTTMASVWDGDNTSAGRRNSRFMPHDPRMDPYTTNIYSRFDNKSHESINTLQDNRDYSRKVLRTTNPDPTDPE